MTIIIFLSLALAAVVPGGNDTLILHGIPSLSAHAIPAYLAMLAGVAVAMAVLQRFTGMTVIVTCSNDICRAGEKTGQG